MTDAVENKIDLTSFTNAFAGMIATNESSYSGRFSRTTHTRTHTYTQEEVERILTSSSVEQKIKLSRTFFESDGIYRRIIIYYATLLKFAGILVPNPAYGKTLSTDFIQKKYHQAIDFIDNVNLPDFGTHIALKVFRDGCYYGILQGVDKKGITLLDLPTRFCTSRFKDFEGNDVVEFDVSYFDTIYDDEERQGALRIYPKVVSNWYRRWKRGKAKSKWVYLPTDITICLPFIDGEPPFIDIIPAILNYDKAVDLDRDRDLEEIRKIIVQKIPHLADGGLLFEPEEAEVMHRGAVNMMKGNKNVSVLTTYADVDAIISKTSQDNATNIISKALENVYSETGSSRQVFSSDSNLALETSINNDMAMVMIFAHKLEKAITKIVNQQYSNSNISFRFKILPISYYNANKYIETTFKLATSGYSFILPALGLDLSQKELIDVKSLENDVLKMDDVLIPLSTAYTQSGTTTGQVGRPAKDDSEKSDKTIANEVSLDKGGSVE